MEVGKLDRRITFQSNVETLGSEGSPQKTWTDCSTNWASYRQENGGEDIQHGRVHPTVMAVFTIRYNPSFTPDRPMRVQYNSTALNIVDIREITGRNRGWEIATRADAE